MRAVLDTNIFVSALISPQGPPAHLLGSLKRGEFTLVLSDALVDELTAVLARPRLIHRFGITPVAAAALVEAIRIGSVLVTAKRRIAVGRDPKDTMLLEAAVASQADVIVTGDADLLALSPFEGIPIVRPAEFLAWLENSAQR